jgi:hypothetical protein
VKALAFAAAVSVVFMAGSASAQNAIDNAAQATGDVVVATGRFGEATGKLVLGVIALPFIAVGKAAEAVGSGVSGAGEAVLDDANGPLVIGGDRWNDRYGGRDLSDVVVVRDNRDRTWHADRNDW